MKTLVLTCPSLYCAECGHALLGTVDKTRREMNACCANQHCSMHMRDVTVSLPTLEAMIVHPKRGES